MLSEDIVDPNDKRRLAVNVGRLNLEMSGWCDAGQRLLAPGVTVNSGMKVVDIGCGDGTYVAFCNRLGAEVTFIDVQEAKVRALETRLREAGHGGKIEGIVSECDPIPVADGHADLVISTEVLEHVKDPEKVLREIVRIGAPDATYCLTVPDGRAEMMVKNLAPPEYFEEPNHINIFSSDDFEELVESCGLEVVSHEYLAGFWAIFFLLKWATSEPGEKLLDTVHPATYHWARAWEEALKHPRGDEMRRALNEALPRSQMIVARKKIAG